MKFLYNPLSAEPLGVAPADDNITFDLPSHTMYVKGVDFVGTDTTYDVFKKPTSSSSNDGEVGLVPVPTYTTTATRYLREDGTWEVPTDFYRPIKVDNTSILGNNNTALNLVAGNNILLTPEQSGSSYTGKVTIAVTNLGATDDDVVVLTANSDSNGFYYDAKHAKKGPSDGYTSGNTTTKISGYGASKTITIPQITVDEYGHVTSAVDEEITITMPSEQALGNYKTKQSIINSPAASGTATAFIDSISLNANGEITVTKKSIVASDLGLTNAMTYIGKTTSNLSDGATTSPIVINSENITPSLGNVVIDSSDKKEYIWNGSNWEEFGNEGNYKVIQAAVSDPGANGDSLSFISNIAQDSNGNITTLNKKTVTLVSNTSAGIVPIVGASAGTIDSLSEDLVLAWNGTSVDWHKLPANAFLNDKGVTSVKMTVPTGLSVSPSEITTSGTFAINYANGYSIPTTAKQNNWDAAYSWGNHAEYGYLTSAVRSVTINGDYLKVNTDGTDSNLTIPYAIKADTLDNYHASTLFEDLSTNTTNAISIKIGNTTKNITTDALKTSLGLGSNAYTSTAYLPLAGGTMNAGAYISWNASTYGDSVSDWDTVTGTGLRIFSSTTSTSKAPTTYCTALHVKGSYGFLIASLGGSGQDSFFIRNTSNDNWNTLLHSKNTHIKDGVITINNTSITPLISHLSLANYVTLTTDLTISGVKTFTKGPVLNSSSIKYTPSTTGGNAVGLNLIDSVDNSESSTTAGIGFLCNTGKFSGIYLGWGSSPWSTGSALYINSTTLTYKNYPILHSNNYTTYINTTNFPGLDKTGTVTSVAVSNGGGLSVSGSPVTSSGTITITNTGVRSTTINGNYLRVNTNGTNADLTIPYASTTSELNRAAATDVNSCYSDLKIKYFTLVGCSATEATGNKRFAGTDNSYGFPVSNNANGLLWLGSHTTNYGHLLGFSSDGRIYNRYISAGSFATTANGGSWKKLAFTSDIPTNLSDLTDDLARVTSVGLSMPTSIFSVTGSPVTSTGTLTASLVTLSPNTILAGPASGTAAPTFRAMVLADHYSPSGGTALSSSATVSSGSFTAVTSLTKDSKGHITAATLKTITLPTFTETYKGTVTSITPGTGLTGTSSDTAITTSGTINLKTAATGEIGGIKASNVLTTAVDLTSANGATASRYYGVQVDKDGKAFVNVPWENTTTGVTGSTTNVLKFYEDNTQKLSWNGNAEAIVDFNSGSGISISSSVSGNTLDYTIALDSSYVQTLTQEFISGTQTAASSSWTGVSSDSSLYDGKCIVYWLPYSSTSTAVTLNLTLSSGSTTGAKNVYYGGATRLTTHYPAGSAIRLVYRENVSINGSGSYTGWWADANYVDGNTFGIRNVQAVKASEAVVAGNIIVGDSSGYHHLKTGGTFDVTYPIYYAGSAISSGSTGTNNYASHNLTITTTQSITLTAYKAVYIKGTISGTTFTPASTTPITQTIPTYEDGRVYMLLGMATSTTTIFLLPEHPLYMYKNGQFVGWIGYALLGNPITFNDYSGSSDVCSIVFKATLGTEGETAAYDTAFTYQPSTDTLTVGKIVASTVTTDTLNTTYIGFNDDNAIAGDDTGITLASNQSIYLDGSTVCAADVEFKQGIKAYTSSTSTTLGYGTTGLVLTSGNGNVYWSTLDFSSYALKSDLSDYVTVAALGSMYLATTSYVDNAIAGVSGGTTVSWGTTSSNTSPLTVAGTTKTVSLSGHTHSYLPLSGGSLTGAVTSSSTITATAFYLDSDKNLKENIELIQNSILNKIYNTNEVTFTWKNNGDRAYGYIAQDMQSISGDLVKVCDDGHLTLDYNSVLVLQVAALKLKINNLEERIQNLERSL